jgi:hypothetical protein
MKFLPALAAVLALVAVDGLRAQDLDFGAQRERIKAGRAAVEARFIDEQKACRAKFAVTDCMRDITRQRNATLADLRRQENEVNDAERRLREQRRQRDLVQRQAERERDDQQRRERAARDTQERGERAAELERKRAEASRPATAAGKTPRGLPGPQGSPRAPDGPGTPNGPTPTEAAKNRAAYEKRLQEAEAYKAEVRARIAKRSKPAASALPVPAAPGSGS